MDDCRLAALIFSGPFALMIILGYYFGVYSAIKHKPKYRSGKGYAKNLQGGVVSWVVTILFAYLFMPAAMGSGPQAQGFSDFFLGVQLLVAGVCVRYTHKVLPEDKHAYQFMLAGGPLFAGLGLLSYGVPWMLYWPASPLVRVFGLVVSLVSLVVCEVTFLTRNKWQILPSDPR